MTRITTITPRSHRFFFRRFHSHFIFIIICLFIDTKTKQSQSIFKNNAKIHTESALGFILLLLLLLSKKLIMDSYPPFNFSTFCRQSTCGGPQPT